MSDPEARLREMLDHHEIRQVLAGRSIDDDGLVRAPGPEYARQMTAIMLDSSEAVWHVLGQSLIKVDGDSAGAETFLLGFMRVKGQDGELRLNQLAGRFVDRLEEGMRAGYGLAAGSRDATDPGAALLGLAHHE